MKEYAESMTYDELWPYLEKVNYVHLATVEEGAPKVRMMAVTRYDKQMWVATWSKWNKVRQIKKDGRMEFSAPFSYNDGLGCARGTGYATVISDDKLRKKVAETISWFKDYWGTSDNEEYILIRLDPEVILLDHPTDKKKYTIHVEKD
ncbi:MAG: hypothetical protein GF411_00600 [Candidatus Lokiarchaeota archaeon]|nr:hypothetical protein [Candidatus Lokiarchaeota archaeon]